jgi:FkbM family methyltransferase
MRRPLKTESLFRIRELDVPVESIIDIGILTGTDELMTTFKDKMHFLVEPIVEWNEVIRASYAKLDIKYELVNVALSDTNGFINMELTSVMPGTPITHAHVTERPVAANVRKVPVRTLDSLLQEYTLPNPYLLKIDVDGIEMKIMKGAETTLGLANVVVIEANIKNFVERALFLQQNGFDLFDIVDPCYYDNRLRQFDLIFLNSKMVQDRNLDMYEQSFDISKWIAYN